MSISVRKLFISSSRCNIDGEIHNKVLMNTTVHAGYWPGAPAVSAMLHLIIALGLEETVGGHRWLTVSSLPDKQFLSQQAEWLLKLDVTKKKKKSVAGDSCKVNQIHKMENVWGFFGDLILSAPSHSDGGEKKCYGEAEQNLYTDSKLDASVVIPGWHCGSSFVHASYLTNRMMINAWVTWMLTVLAWRA